MTTQKNSKEIMVSPPKGSGNGMFTLFTILLILKLTDTIDWSWWWITSPLWMPILILFVMFILFILIVLIVSMIDK